MIDEEPILSTSSEDDCVALTAVFPVSKFVLKTLWSPWLVKQGEVPYKNYYNYHIWKGRNGAQKLIPSLRRHTQLVGFN